MDASRLVFLGGSPRSGTTLVQNMLDSHPEILGGPEFLHLQDIVGVRQKLQISVGKNWIDLFCSPEDVDREIRELIMRLLLPFADRQGARILSEKTPENVLVFPGLVELFPESKFVLVVRDPRAIIASMLSVAQRARDKGEQPAHFTRDVAAASTYVRRCMGAGFRAAAAAPEQVYVVVYERLVNDPEPESRALCEFLGVDFDEALTRPGEQEHLGEAAITTASQDIWYDKETYYSNPNTASLEKWRSQLTAAQQLVINEAFSGFAPLIELGYELDAPALSGAGGFAATMQKRSIQVRDRTLIRLRKLLGD